MKKFLIGIFLLVSISFAQEEPNQQLKMLLAIIQGTFKDKVYTVTIEKAKEYLSKAPKNDKYIDEVVKILAYSYVKTNNKNDFIKFLKYVNTLNLKKNTKIYLYKLAADFIDQPQEKSKYLLELYKLTNNDKYLQILANILYKNKNWQALISLPDNKKINHLKVYALYKLGKYKQVIDYTDKLNKFSKNNLDFVLYYRGLSFLKLGNNKSAALAFEKLEEKDNKIKRFLADFYIKNKDFTNAEKYLKDLAKDPNTESYAFYYLGYIYQQKKNYKKTLEYYKKALSFNDKYSIASLQSILKLKAKNLVPKESYYSIRVVLYKKQRTAEKFIKKHNLSQCFIYPFKHFYGVYCGLFTDKKQAKENLKILKETLKIKDVLVDKIKL